ncbi:HlyD family secretion protein [Fuerstiella marisgermanici]|uniref:Putative efflux pump membrane fusion protein n=1 Tax=Fuerstiella marisgermanici TaxID=1891926 RepID=A0A1P8WED2_9PLAN|nr:efflux RND transporter periplasmic adaptor subunit [Fuerstiella marisgermanici]APZ92426.1 putative efflux pump membrane fusion protein [Fuerstiella marisgermanici]
MPRFIVSLIAAAVLIGLLVYSQQTSGPLVVSGFIEADEIRVGSRVGGRVLNVLVSEGQTVATDQVLVQLEPFDLLERKAEAEQMVAVASAAHDKLVAGSRPEEVGQAEARVRQIQAGLDLLNNGPRPQEIAAAEADVRLAEAKLALAKKVYHRVETLFGKQAADKSDLDESATKLSVALAAVDSRIEQLALLKEGSRAEDKARAKAQLDEAKQQLALQKNGFRAEEIREAKARLDAASASLRIIERQLDELQIVSPADAVVEAIELQPGDLVSPNAPAISLVNSELLWVRAYVPEDHLNLQTGQAVDVKVDSFPDRTFAGEVVFVARQAEFTPANVQTPEERSKQVFRIKVRLVEGLDVLRPGMAADVILSSEGNPA